jgi:hypothetical protein
MKISLGSVEYQNVYYFKLDFYEYNGDPYFWGFFAGHVQRRSLFFFRIPL